MRLMAIGLCMLLTACGTLERKSGAISPGDDRSSVMRDMGAPGDRQFNGNLEVWQYCQTGAGFGYHDYRMVWFREGRVVAVNSYKDHTPASGCGSHFKSIDWTQAPQ